MDDKFLNSAKSILQLIALDMSQKTFGTETASPHQYCAFADVGSLTQVCINVHSKVKKAQVSARDSDLHDCIRSTRIVADTRTLLHGTKHTPW